MASINQTGAGIRLPNFCNLGVMLRALVLVNLFCLAAAVLRARGLEGLWVEFLLVVVYAEPVLILSLVVLCAARRWLHALGYLGSIAALAAFELAVSWVLVEAFRGLAADRPPMPFAQLAFLVLFVTGCTLAYFDLRSRALAPAVAEARIQALQARIRPHFLFNSINAVLSLIRSEPRRAERVLEDLADLFRVLMADNSTLTPIAKEVELVRQYLAIETLRLGERLRVSWRTESMPADALVPPLVLQPLVENAVYHGIEPAPAGGEIAVEVRKEDGRLVMVLTNPYGGEGRHPPGNRMAIANIRERLQLHYDAEASMRTAQADGVWEVRILLPYVPAP